MQAYFVLATIVGASGRTDKGVGVRLRRESPSRPLSLAFSKSSNLVPRASVPLDQRPEDMGSGNEIRNQAIVHFYINACPEEHFPFVWKNRLLRWEIKWNGPFHWKFFDNKGIPSEVFLFSRFSRNDRKFSVPFATTSLLANRARSTNEPKNAKIYPLYRFKLIQNSCRL